MRRMRVAMVWGVLAWAALLTHVRLEAWRDDTALWTAAVHQQRHNARATFNLGVAELHTGHDWGACDWFAETRRQWVNASPRERAHLDRLLSHNETWIDLYTAISCD